MSQLNKWMIGGKISKMVVVITSKDTGEHVERWQFDVSSDLLRTSNPRSRESRLTASQVQIFGKATKMKSSMKVVDKENTAPGYISCSSYLAFCIRVLIPAPTVTCRHRQRKKLKKRFKTRSKQSSDRLRRQLAFCRCWMVTAHSTCLFTLMPT